MLAFVLWLACVVLVVRAAMNPSARSQRPFLVAAAGVCAVLAVVVGPDAFVMQKVIGLCLLPMGLVFCGLWLSTTVALGRGELARARLLGTIALLFTVVGNEPLGHLENSWLERDFLDDPAAQGTFDAVFVLGGGAAIAPHPDYELGPSGDRIALAARLYHRGQTPLLVTSGTPIAGLSDGFDSIGATQRIWLDLGVPREAIVPMPGLTRNTREEAAQARVLTTQRGWTRIGLVTSAWHMRRALRLFHAQGLQPVPIAADHRGGSDWDGLIDLVPTGMGAFLMQKASWELLGGLVDR